MKHSVMEHIVMGREKKRRAMELRRKKEPAPHSVLYRRRLRPATDGERRRLRNTGGQPVQARYLATQGRSSLYPVRFCAAAGFTCRPSCRCSSGFCSTISDCSAIRRLGKGFPVPLVVGVAARLRCAAVRVYPTARSIKPSASALRRRSFFRSFTAPPRPAIWSITGKL